MTGRACTRPVSLPPITFTFVESSTLLEPVPASEEPAPHACGA